jgi:flagellar hook-length control protein FliK
VNPDGAAKPAGGHAAAGQAAPAAPAVENTLANDGTTPSAPSLKTGETAPVTHAAPTETRSESAASAPAQAVTAPVSANPPIAPLSLVAPAMLSPLMALRVERPSDNAIPVAGLAVEIVARAQEGSRRFEIRLDPPELGRIDVRLHVDGDGQVTSHVRVERADTLDLLRRDAPQLERALQQAGLKTFDGGMQFSLRDQSFAQREQNQNMPAVARIVVPDETLATIETQRSYGRLAGLGSGVDIRV